jgi:uncharacterized membrane protein
MWVYEIVTLIHIAFAIVALVTGIIAMTAKPKGSNLHKKAGLVYFYSFIGIMTCGLLMSCIKYNNFFFAITIFNAYFLFTGYRVLKNKNSKANWMDWSMLAIFFFGGLLMIIDVLKIKEDFLVHSYKWNVVFAFHATMTFYFVAKDFKWLRNKTIEKQTWLYKHMEKILITYISIIVGATLRLSDYTPVIKDLEVKWLCWIIPYLVCLPLIAYWISKYKTKTFKQK